MSLLTLPNASILCLIFVASASSLCRWLQPLQLPKGVVRGRVIGVNPNAGVPDVRVIVKGATARREVVTDDSGSYQVELPADVYTITTDVAGYYAYRRAPFRVPSGTTAIINLLLSYRLHDTGFGDTPTIHYDKLALPDPSDDRLSLLVEYENRKERRNSIEYDGAKLYYDTLAVSAVHLTLDKKDFKFKASGNVHVDNAQQDQAYVRQANVSFVRGTPIVQLMTGAIDYIRGKGSISGDNINFEFRIEKDRAGQFIYEDAKAGISFTAEVYSFGVIDDGANKVQFVGRAKIRFRRSEEDLKPVADYDIPLQFIVTVQDNGDIAPDTFSISIDLDSVLKRSGKLSKGDIEVHRQY